MSSPDKCFELSDSISKLKSLREKLCKNNNEWKKAFEVRDYVISNLNKLQLKLDDEETSKKECASELRKILQYFEDNNNV
tara:strand:- start:174 stop:413 length:240 start_codon:yes stop_codon:yes gene_type:complete